MCICVCAVSFSVSGEMLSLKKRHFVSHLVPVQWLLVVGERERESKCVQVSEWILASSSLLLLSAACTFAMYSYMGGML